MARQKPSDVLACDDGSDDEVEDQNPDEGADEVSSGVVSKSRALLDTYKLEFARTRLDRRVAIAALRANTRVGDARVRLLGSEQWVLYLPKGTNPSSIPELEQFVVTRCS